jgi:GNAT superfamily N-acetyltransferase
MICVASQATGKGLATKLMKWSERIAHEEAGCKVLTAETTGAASARVFEKMAFEKANVLEYDDFIDKIGQKPFEHLDPHKSCIAWIKVKEIQS